MIPVVITTSDRPALCALTLRSVAAAFPPDNYIAICIDSEYYSSWHPYSGNTVATVNFECPNDPRWTEAGLDRLCGIWPVELWKVKDLEVIKSELTPGVYQNRAGVVVNTIAAINLAFKENPKANSIVLFQDDVLCTRELYSEIEKGATVAGYNRAGIISYGCTIHGRHVPCARHTEDNPQYFSVPFSGLLCWQIFREFYSAHKNFFNYHHADKIKSVDVLLSQLCIRSNRKLLLRKPYLIQHIGLESVVRPNVRFFSRLRCRLMPGVSGPYTGFEPVDHAPFIMEVPPKDDNEPLDQ